MDLGYYKRRETDMTKTMDIQKQMETLREEVIKHDMLYANGKPVISDSDYDKLYARLVELERLHPSMKTEDSPTQRIVDKLVDGLIKVTHSQPMLSQEKAHTEADLNRFLAKASDEWLVQQKLDGLTIVLKYQNGLLQEAVTRGDGYVGESVIHVIRNVTNIPAHIPFEGYLELRAEAIIPYIEFERVNVDGQYRSPRNLVSGSVRTLSASTAKERGVQLIVFDVITIEGHEFQLDTERLAFIRQLGFPVVETKVFSKEETKKLKEYVLNYNNTIRPTLPHMVDGLVLKINNLKKREVLGYTSKYPRWAVAFKFESLDATTKCTDVVWTIGPSGQLTPNAVLEPVEIDGVVIGKASLANIDNVRKRDIRIGDTVVVTRANDVIPQVVSSIPELRTGEEREVEIPHECPVCGGKIVVDGWKPMCVNPLCSAQLKRKLEVFVSRPGLNINGLGGKTIDAFYEAGLVRTYPDIYELENKVNAILELQGFAQKGVDKMLQGIEESKQAPLSKFLFALSIPNCGEGTSKRIAQSFGSMDQILSLNETDLRMKLLDVEDIGDIVADTVVQFFMNEENRRMIQLLLSYGFTAKEEVKAIVQSEGVTGKIFVVTGSLESGSRNDIKKKIEERGGKVSGSVSKSTDYLVMGGYNHITGEGLNPTSSKSKKALELGVNIISEEQLLVMLG